MAAPAPDPLGGVLSDIKLIRDQVDELQLEAAEKRAPWYKQPSVLISVIALAVSTATTVWTYFVQERAGSWRAFSSCLWISLT
jgi:hypothetical protein